jgi:two-component system response regulator NreC
MIVDDHAVLREGIRALLARQPDMTVVGMAESGAEGIELARTCKPDVILMDISMPGMDGLEATRQIRAHDPQARILVLTQHEDEELIVPLLQAGAAGYIFKRAGGAELVGAIRAVHSEGAFLHPRVARLLMNQVSRVEDPAEPHLTEREKQVLTLIAEGLTGREIAEKLSLSEKTVIAHRTSIMDKLNLHHVADLVRYAIREGLVEA